MKLLLRRFNNYLLCGAVLLGAGCASSGPKRTAKEAGSLSLFLETNPDNTGRTAVVQVVRAAPVLISIDRSPFLDERNLVQAAVVDAVGGFALQVKFDMHGTLVLDTVTAANKGKRMAIFSMFTEGRWLGAPRISTRISDGVLTFTPDATREEAEEIARRLNNVAEALHNKPKTKR
jgi:preprotein translocase subunit SecD